MFQNLLFGALVLYAWALAMFIDPVAVDDIRTSDRVLYAATVMPAALFILACLPSLARLRYARASLVLVVLLVAAAAVSILRGDLATALSVGSLCAMLIAIQHSEVSVDLKLVNRLFFVSILATEVLFLLGLSRYGILPGQAVNDNVPWRASLFAHSVTPSWLYALIVLGMNYFHNRSAVSRLLIMSLAFYFVIFSASRTALIVIAICAVFLACTRVIDLRKRAFYSLFIPIACVLFVVTLSAEQILALLTGFDNPLVNTVLFKSAEGATSAEQVGTSIVRTFIWTAHVQIFAENPLLGHGTFNLLDRVPEFATVASTGSESFITALFARIGLLAALFVYFVYLLAADAARRRDRFGFSMVILFALTMLAYGSYIVPYDFIFLVLFGAMNYRPHEATVIAQGSAVSSSSRDG